MTTQAAEISADIPCHRCGYDLRAHPPDGKCPECGASVAESQRLAAIPRRPAWRDSDPRWRRRMFAGAWILVLLPLVDALHSSGWAEHVTVPNVFHLYGTILKLDESFLWLIYQPLLFCIGVVLFFSRERGRRRNRLDWTRRWGIICSYVTLLLSSAPVLFITSLVLVGIGALCISMPLKYQPRTTLWFVNVGTIYLWYGPQPKILSHLMLIAFSSIAMLLACIPLFDALRSTGRRRLAATLVAPLALFSVIQLAQTAAYYLGVSNMTVNEATSYGWYFRPDVLVGETGIMRASLSDALPYLIPVSVELLKWCIVLAIALWLSIAQLLAWRNTKRKKPEHQLNTQP